MSGHTPWAKLRDKLYPRPRVAPPLPLPLAVGGPWRDAYVVMTAAGHKPSGLADIGGGYLCACRKASWSNLERYGPYGSCEEGYWDAVTFLAKYGVKDGAE